MTDIRGSRPKCYKAGVSYEIHNAYGTTVINGVVTNGGNIITECGKELDYYTTEWGNDPSDTSCTGCMATKAWQEDLLQFEVGFEQCWSAWNRRYTEEQK